jgi:hypothetical protein
MWLAYALWIKTRAHAKSCMNINHPAVGSVSSTDRGEQELILQTVASAEGVGAQSPILVLPFQRNAGLRALLHLTVVGSAAATRYVEICE